MTNEDKILQLLTGMSDRMDAMSDRIDTLSDRMDAMSDRMDNFEVQLKETNQIVKAILHNQEVANAEIVALKTTTASTKVMEQVLNTQKIQGDFLNLFITQKLRAAAEITQLKIAE